MEHGKINVVHIDETWDICRYKYRVFVKDAHTNHKYILETLRKWFGAAEYFWDDMFLCGLKS